MGLRVSEGLGKNELPRRCTQYFVMQKRFRGTSPLTSFFSLHFQGQLIQSPHAQTPSKLKSKTIKSLDIFNFLSDRCSFFTFENSHSNFLSSDPQSMNGEPKQFGITYNSISKYSSFISSSELLKKIKSITSSNSVCFFFAHTLTEVFQSLILPSVCPFLPLSSLPSSLCLQFSLVSFFLFGSHSLNNIQSSLSTQEGCVPGPTMDTKI